PRVGALGARHGPHHLRGSEVGGMGVVAAHGQWPHVALDVPGVLADPRRVGGRRAVHEAHAARGGARRRPPGESLVVPDPSAASVTVPMLLIGLGMGALASQLGSVTVSAVPDELSPEVGGLQNTASQFGASLGTALAGSVLIASLSASFLSGVSTNPAVPPEV